MVTLPSGALPLPAVMISPYELPVDFINIL